MTDINVRCPSCFTDFPLGDGVLSSVRSGLESEMTHKLAEERAKFEKRAAELAKAERAKAAEEAALELKHLRGELEESSEKLKAAKTLELENLKQQKALAEKAQSLELDVEKQVAARLSRETEEIEKRLKAKATEEASAALKDAQSQIAEQKAALAKATEAQAALLKRERELQSRSEQLEIETQRRIAAQREEIRKEALSQADESHRLRIQEFEKKLADAAKAKDDLARKLEQGSQQTQGDVLEQDIKAQLQQNFLMDQVEDVPTGIKGADLLHTVVNQIGTPCGQIVIETKNTKGWTAGWLKKLKDDTASVKGDIPVIISTALPDGVSSFAHIDGVWVCSFGSALSLITTLRWSLIELARTKSAVAGMEDNKDLIYQYFTGPEFKNRVESVVTTIDSMRGVLEQERKALTKHWASREKQIENVTRQLLGMQGDIQGIAHNEVSALDLDWSDGVAE